MTHALPLRHGGIRGHPRQLERGSRQVLHLSPCGSTTSACIGARTSCGWILPPTPQTTCARSRSICWKRCGYREDVYIRPLAFKSQELVANLKLHELEDNFCVIIVPFGAYNRFGLGDPVPDVFVAAAGRHDAAHRREDHRSSTRRVFSPRPKRWAAGYDEAILLNNDGTVSEGSGENLFLIQNGRVSTPKETDNCLLGSPGSQ